MGAKKSDAVRASDARLLQDAPTASEGIARLLEIMERLRDPETGCPWDVKQSSESIAPYAIDEAYEVVDAIERGSMADLCDELGDLQLQVVYHAQMAREKGAFEMADVLRAVCEKMIRRHPHVFADAAEPPDWETIKAEERRLKAAGAALGGAPETRESAPGSALDGAPTALPALSKAVDLQKRAAKVGFDWPDLGPVLGKIVEESQELAEAQAALAAASRGEEADRRAALVEEFGDLLFVMANFARWLKIDPEDALRRANAKFDRRFRAVEAGLAAEGKRPEQVDLAEMDQHWEAAKRAERAAKSRSHQR